MADPAQIEKKAEADTSMQRNYLQPNPFREGARAVADTVMENAIARSTNNTKLTMLGGLPVYRGDYVAAGLGTVQPKDWKAFRERKDFVIFKFANGRLDTMSPAESYGLDQKAMEKLAEDAAAGKACAPGAFPALDDDIARYKSMEAGERPGAKEVMRVVAIYIAKPLDCLQFVNLAIASTGARPVNPMSGRDLTAALLSPGKAIIASRESLCIPDEKGKLRIIDDQKVTDFFKNARPGDVMLFLNRDVLRTVSDGREAEKIGGDLPIWLDREGSFVNVSGMKGKEKPGVSYFVAHGGVYAGLDENGRAMSAQAHILVGNVSQDLIAKYMGGQGKILDAVAVISLDFFMKNAPVAEAPEAPPPDTGFVKIARVTQ